MALNAVRGRHTGPTYGKKTTKLGNLSPTAFKSLLNTPQKPRSTLSRISSQAKASRTAGTPHQEEEVFDVPLSETEEDARSKSSSSHPISGMSTVGGRKRLTRRQEAENVTKSSDKSTTDLQQAKKRKRDVPKSSALPQGTDNSSSRVPMRRSHESPARRRRKLDPFQPASSDSNEPPKTVRDNTLNDGTIPKSLVQRPVSSLKSASYQPVPAGNGILNYDETKDDDPRQTRLEIIPETPKTQRVLQPQVIPMTPSPKADLESSSSSRSKVVTTPRQRVFFDDLIGSRHTTPVHEIQKLHSRSEAKPANHPRPSESTKTRRLIDSLKSSYISDSSESNGSDGEPMEPEASSSQANEEQNLMSNTSSTSTSAQVFSKVTKVTYAQQRSYLSEPSQGLDDLLSQPLDSHITSLSGTKSSGTSLKERQIQDVDADDQDGANDAMKSIHELRLAGDSRRFDDEMSVILDDIANSKKSALSSKRAAWLDLARKLCDESFKTRFVQGDYEVKLFNLCSDEQDPVCIVAISGSVVAILSEPVDPQSAHHIASTGILRPLSAMLHRSQNLKRLVKDRKMNMSRIAQQDVNDFIETVYTPSKTEFAIGAAISPQMTALQAIELCLRKRREAGSIDNLLEPAAISDIVELITSYSSVLLPRTSEDVMEAAKSKLKMACSALESLSISPPCAADERLWPQVLVSKIAQSGKRVLLAHINDVNLHCLLFRLFLNLSNNSEINSALFADEAFLDQLMEKLETQFQSLHLLSEGTGSTPEFDELLLALGTLFNLAEMSAEVRQILAMSTSNALEDLVSLFNVQSERTKDAESLAESQVNVAIGYLAVLLGLICQEPNGRVRIQRGLRGREMGALIGAIEEFTMHHQKVDGEGSNEVWRGFTDRLQCVADSLKLATVQ